MQREFRHRGGGYRRDGVAGRFGVRAHLWPAARAFVATLDLVGIAPALRPGFDAEAALAWELAALERYWDPRGAAGAYGSDPHRTPFGGDRYYDDNAWVGLGLIQLERLRPGSEILERVGALWDFALAGVDQRSGAGRGGVFWVEQGRGIGRRNHDRNTVSTAPNVAVALHLAELSGAGTAVAAAESLHAWVLATLDAGGDGAGPFADKVRGDGSVDRTIWSYNQGSMVAISVLRARLAADDPSRTECLAHAERIARRTLAHFADGGFSRQPPAFNAICFRNLLMLSAASRDAELRAAIVTSVREYTEAAWEHARDDDDRFHLRQDGVTLLGQSAMVQILALLAWEPAGYGRLA
jgi:hypothetical protein